MRFHGHDPHFPNEETESQKKGGSFDIYSLSFFEYLQCIRNCAKILVDTMVNKTEPAHLDMNEIIM